MQYNEEFRQVVKERFKFGIKTNYLPDQKYINRLIASLDRVEANSYDLSETAFIFEFNDLKENDITQSIRIFVDGCLNQLCWINSIIESGKFAHTEEELDQVAEEFANAEVFTIEEQVEEPINVIEEELSAETREEIVEEPNGIIEAMNNNYQI